MNTDMQKYGDALVELNLHVKRLFPLEGMSKEERIKLMVVLIHTLDFSFDLLPEEWKHDLEITSTPV